MVIPRRQVIAMFSRGLARCGAWAVAAALIATPTRGLAQVGATQPKTVKSKGHVLVELAPLAKFFGAKVSFSKRTKAISITALASDRKGKIKISMRIGSTKATVNGKTKKLPVAPQILTPAGESKGKTMVPLRWTAEALRGKVDVQSGGIISICAPNKQCMAVKMPE